MSASSEARMPGEEGAVGAMDGSDAIAMAISSVSWEAFATAEEGKILPQVSSPSVIADVLRLLEPRRGERVLEIGTGSGYSTAVLAKLVGPTGQVVSVEMVPELVPRARRLLARHGVRNAEAIVGDGRKGHRATAPYDRIVAWATARELPGEWVAQLAPGGVVVAPVRLLPRAYCVAVARLLKVGEEHLRGERLIPGGFAPLDEAPRRRWCGPAGEAEFALMEDGEYPEPILWLSAAWLEALPQEQRLEAGLALLGTATRLPIPLASGENPRGLQAYLMATDPAGLTTGYTRDLGLCIGYSDSAGLALVALSQEAAIASGASLAWDILATWVREWRAAGQPGFDRVLPFVEQVGTDLMIRACLTVDGGAVDPE